MWEDFDFDARQQEMDFSTGGNVIMDYRYILRRGNGLKLKRLNDGFVFYKHTAFVISFRLPVDWSGVDYCDVFISCLDSFWGWRHFRET